MGDEFRMQVKIPKRLMEKVKMLAEIDNLSVQDFITKMVTVAVSQALSDADQPHPQEENESPDS